MSHYGFNMLKGGTEWSNNLVKNPIYSAPVVEGLNRSSLRRTRVVFYLFYSLLLGILWVFKHKYLQIKENKS